MVIFSIRNFFNHASTDSIESLRKELSLFVCSKNADVQSFLHNKAIDYEISHRARTYICLNDEVEIIGFFTIGIRDLEIKSAVPKNTRKRLTYGMTDVKHIPAYLIGQLAKCDTCSDRIGKQLIETAIEYIKHSQDYVGGRVVYLDCEDALCKFYEKLGFNYLQDNKDLKQMIQII